MRRHFSTVLGGHQSLSSRPPARQPTEALEAAASAPTEVPDLVGLPSTDARRLARAARLAVTLEERNSGEELWGRVLTQDPLPGTSGTADDVVLLTVGARPRVAVPDVRGREEDEALSMLREVGLGADRRATRRSDRVPEGCVVRTRPRAGAEVATGSRVSYVVAAGSHEAGGGDRRHGRRPVRAMLLADGSFVFPSKGSDRRRD